MKKSLSIKDISAMSGVSIATVSRIINGNGRYSKETEEKVKAIIKEYHYVPSMVAKGLRTHRMDNIGIIVPDITNEFFVKLVHELESTLFAASYSSLICNTNENVEVEQKYLQMLKMQNVSGIIYISGGYNSDYKELAEIPTVFIDRVPNRTRNIEKFVMIESDNRQGGYIATRELLEKGCRKVVMLTDRRRLSSQKERIEGYLAAHADYRVPCDERYIVDLDSIDFKSAHDKVSQLLDEGLEFDGVFGTTDWLALGAYVALITRRVRVPEQVKIVGFDDISVSEFNALPITTVHQQVDIIGQTAVKSMLQLVQNKPVKARENVVPVYLVKRQST